MNRVPVNEVVEFDRRLIEFVPAMQNVFGYGFGTLPALVILWYVFVNNRGRIAP